MKFFKKVFSNSTNQSRLILILSLFSLASFLLAPYWHFGKIYELSLDQQNQYNLFYLEWFRMLKEFIKTGYWPFWSWNLFLGTNFYASKAYYLVGDVFTYLAFLFSFITKNYLVWMTILKIVISGLVFHEYLVAIQLKKSMIRFLFSFIYAFSGFALIFISEYMFHSFYVLLPLLFLGVERVYQKKSFNLLTFSTLLLLLANFYFFYPTAIIVFLYSVYRVNWSQKEHSVKRYLQMNMKVVWGVLVGAGISSFLLLPAILYIIQSPRLTSPQAIPVFWDLKVYFAFVLNFWVSPYSLYTNLPYPFYSGVGGHAQWFTTYTSIIILWVIALVFVSRENALKKKISVLVLLGIFVFPYLDSIMHGFNEPSTRWLFLFTFLILAIGSMIFEEFEFTKQEIQKAFLITLSFLGLVLIAAFLTHQLDFSNNYIYLVHVFMGMILFSLYGYLLFKKQYLIITLVVIFEISFSWYTRLNQLAVEYTNYEYPLNLEYIDYFKQQDQINFQRVYIRGEDLVPFNEVSYNQSLYYRLPSTKTYDSTYQYSLAPFLHWNGIDWHIINLEDSSVLRLLGVRYYGVANEEELPSSMDFTYKYDLNHIHMYELSGYNSIGHTYSNFITTYDSSIDWNTTLIVDSTFFERVKSLSRSQKEQLRNVITQNNYFSGEITVQSSQVLFLSIPYDSGWSILDNGTTTEIQVVDGGFMGVYLEPGEHIIEGYFVPDGFKIGVIISVVSFVLLVTSNVVQYFFMRFNDRKDS